MHGQVEFDEDRFEAVKATAPYLQRKLVSSKVEMSWGEMIDELAAKKLRDKASELAYE